MAANGRRRTEEEVRAYSQGFDDGVSATLEQMARGDILDPSAGIRRMAMGGLVTRPTLTLLGEEGPELVVPLTETKRTRKKTPSDRKMKKALEQANAKARKKNGELRKGWSQSRIMKTAHKLKRQMS